MASLRMFEISLAIWASIAYSVTGQNEYFLIEPGQKACQKEVAACEPLEGNATCFGVKLPYKFTYIDQVEDSISQREIHEKLLLWSGLRNVPKCWEVVQPFLCSAYLPRCHPGAGGSSAVVELAGRDLCELTREPCQIVADTRGWPGFLQCNNSFFPNTCKSAGSSSKSLRFNTTGTCEAPLVRTTNPKSWYGQVEGCGIQCQNPLFSDEEHREMRILIAVFGGICFVTTLFTVLTFMIDWKNANRYPAVILFFINLMYCLGTGGWLAQFIPGARDDIVCRRDGTSRIQEPQVGSGESAACAIVFVVVYFSMIAGITWFVVLTYAWHLSFGVIGKPAHNIIHARRSYFHILAWSVPLVLTIACLAVTEIDGDSLSGICFVGHMKHMYRGIFVLVPVGLVLVVGLVFLIRGLVLLVKLKITRPGLISDKASAKIRETIIRIGTFAILAFCFVLITFIVHVYIFTNEPAWRKSFEDFVICEANVSIARAFSPTTPGVGSAPHCSPTSRPHLVAMEFHVLAYFLSGVTMSSWVWNRAALHCWRRFWRKRFNLPNDEPVKLRKHEVIAQAFQKRREMNAAGRLSLSFASTHDDPLGLRYDLASVTSNEMSSVWAAALPRMMMRRGGLTHPVNFNRRFSDSDVESLQSTLKQLQGVESAAPSRRVSSSLGGDSLSQEEHPPPPSGRKQHRRSAGGRRRGHRGGPHKNRVAPTAPGSGCGAGSSTPGSVPGSKTPSVVTSVSNRHSKVSSNVTDSEDSYATPPGARGNRRMTAYSSSKASSERRGTGYSTPASGEKVPVSSSSRALAKESKRAASPLPTMRTVVPPPPLKQAPQQTAPFTTQRPPKGGGFDIFTVDHTGGNRRQGAAAAMAEKRQQPSRSHKADTAVPTNRHGGGRRQADTVLQMEKEDIELQNLEETESESESDILQDDTMSSIEFEEPQKKPAQRRPKIHRPYTKPDMQKETAIDIPDDKPKKQRIVSPNEIKVQESQAVGQTNQNHQHKRPDYSIFQVEAPLPRPPVEIAHPPPPPPPLSVTPSDLYSEAQELVKRGLDPNSRRKADVKKRRRRRDLARRLAEMDSSDSEYFRPSRRNILPDDSETNSRKHARITEWVLAQDAAGDQEGHRTSTPRSGEGHTDIDSFMEGKEQEAQILVIEHSDSASSEEQTEEESKQEEDVAKQDEEEEEVFDSEDSNMTPPQQRPISTDTFTVNKTPDSSAEDKSKDRTSEEEDLRSEEEDLRSSDEAVRTEDDDEVMRSCDDDEIASDDSRVMTPMPQRPLADRSQPLGSSQTTTALDKAELDDDDDGFHVYRHKPRAIPPFSHPPFTQGLHHIRPSGRTAQPQHVTAEVHKPRSSSSYTRRYLHPLDNNVLSPPPATARSPAEGQTAAASPHRRSAHQRSSAQSEASSQKSSATPRSLIDIIRKSNSSPQRSRRSRGQVLSPVRRAVDRGDTMYRGDTTKYRGDIDASSTAEMQQQQQRRLLYDDDDEEEEEDNNGLSYCPTTSPTYSGRSDQSDVTRALLKGLREHRGGAQSPDVGLTKFATRRTQY